jgi:hypothetical protein
MNLKKWLKRELGSSLVEFTCLLSFVCLAGAGWYVRSGKSVNSIWASCGQKLDNACDFLGVGGGGGGGGWHADHQANYGGLYSSWSDWFDSHGFNQFGCDQNGYDSNHHQGHWDSNQHCWKP